MICILNISFHSMEDLLEGLRVEAVRKLVSDSNWDESGRSAGGKKHSGSGYILKHFLARVANNLNVG